MYICCACKCSTKGTKSFFEFSEIIYGKRILKTLTPILTPSIKITNSSAVNNICTQGNDTSVSHLLMKQKMKSLLQLHAKELKATFVLILYLI